MDQDILYHLALGSGSHDLVEMFGDVKVSDDDETLMGNKLPLELWAAIVVCSFTFLCNNVDDDSTHTRLVRLHGRHTETNGKLCTLHHGRDRL